ncbi:MAG: hypothetical protein BGN86_01415 [Caulobacterales bacterium 68-7]|nr:MAG: hypothetical protein BGN86_01415 [Caulobacterales bacterium 68-7]
MTVRTLRLAALATMIAGLAAAPALANQTSEQTAAQPAPATKTAERTETAADAQRYATQTAAVARTAKKAAPAHSRTAKEIWRERHHLPNAN